MIDSASIPDYLRPISLSLFWLGLTVLFGFLLFGLSFIAYQSYKDRYPLLKNRVLKSVVFVVVLLSACFIGIMAYNYQIHSMDIFVYYAFYIFVLICMLFFCILLSIVIVNRIKTIKDLMKNKVLAFFIILWLVTIAGLEGYSFGEFIFEKPQLRGKPVIYLYPTQQQNVQVSLNFKGKLTCTYPDYKNGWNVLALPDGTLVNHGDGKEYSYLFWEGESTQKIFDMHKGFVIKGSETKDFLQEKLCLFGLTPREYNEFIVYWLPHMQDNTYNFITFAGKEYDESAKLTISPKPDSVLRVFMGYKPLKQNVKVENQIISPFQRTGFTVVEWGASEIK